MAESRTASSSPSPVDCSFTDPVLYLAYNYRMWFEKLLFKVYLEPVINKSAILCVLFVVHVDRLVKEKPDCQERVREDRFKILNYLRLREEGLYEAYQLRYTQ